MSKTYLITPEDENLSKDEIEKRAALWGNELTKKNLKSVFDEIKAVKGDEVTIFHYTSVSTSLCWWITGMSHSVLKEKRGFKKSTATYLCYSPLERIGFDFILRTGLEYFYAHKEDVVESIKPFMAAMKFTAERMFGVKTGKKKNKAVTAE